MKTTPPKRIPKELMPLIKAAVAGRDARAAEDVHAWAKRLADAAAALDTGLTS